MLLDALEGMFFEYKYDKVSQKAEPVLAAYGLVSTEPYRVAPNGDALNKAAAIYKAHIGYGLPNAKWIGDRSSLSDRSQALLILLAGVTYGSLSFEHEDKVLLEHVFMQAGEFACFQLAAYALLDPQPFGGFANPLGLKAAAFALSDAFQPLDAIYFE